MAWAGGGGSRRHDLSQPVDKKRLLDGVFNHRLNSAREVFSVNIGYVRSQYLRWFVTSKQRLKQRSLADRQLHVVLDRHIVPFGPPAFD